MADQNQNEQQQHQTSEHQDSQQSLDPQPNGRQFDEQQQPTDQVSESDKEMREGIRKAVAKNMGGKRDRSTKRLNDSQKAQRVNPHFRSPAHPYSDRIK